MVMELSKAAKIFKALSCEQRLKLLKMLLEWEGIDECCDGVVKAFTRASEELNISRSTLSHHFKELESSGIINCVRNGQTLCCKVNEEVLDSVMAFLK
jgi:ArsR family transcriptional regulator